MNTDILTLHFTSYVHKYINFWPGCGEATEGFKVEVVL